ncbi:MAG: ATP-binding protein [Bacteroidetes bacterium]|nr:ATP-binding protein [Bacteroidota bacterium]
MISRILQPFIEKELFKGKIIILYGARRTGKTTLVKEIRNKYNGKSGYFSCDEPDIRDAFTEKTSTELKKILGDNKLVILDEAQRVKNIGITLKLIADNIKNIQVIATGSSSFDLSNMVIEPLTGRKREFFLFPLTIEELQPLYSAMEISRLVQRWMILGLYPEIVISETDAEKNLKEIARSYSYKDILQFQNIRNPEILEKLLQALSVQSGNEVSYNELADLLQIDKNTVSGYIRILEKAFIIFRLGPFSRNLRTELKKLRKIYFYDTGIRNALINNFNPLHLRQDTGSLWENFLISERRKYLFNHGLDIQSYYWRTKQQQEIDYLEEGAGKMRAFEIKWKKESFKTPEIFSKTYPGCPVGLINNKNYFNFCTSEDI